MNTKYRSLQQGYQIGSGRTAQTFDLFDSFVYVTLVLYSLTFSVTRFFGTEALLVVVSLLSVFAIKKRTLIYANGLSLFGFFSIAILCLSLLGVMPDSWTIYRDNFAAFRHWAWLPIVLLSANAFYHTFKDHYKFIEERAWLLFPAAYLIGLIAKRESPLDEPYFVTDFLYTLTNENTIVILLFVVFLFAKPRHKLLQLVFVITMLFLSTSSQSQIFFLVLTSMLISGLYKYAIVFLFISLNIFIFVSPNYLQELHALDPNTGFRVLLWRDTLIALRDTLGIGVGYGTEYISNDFKEIHDEFWYITPEYADDRLFIGTHSTIYDIALRNGILGCALFMFWYVKNLIPPMDMHGKNLKIFLTVAAMLVINNYVNMGFTAMSYLFGTGACLGYMRFLRDLPQESSDKLAQAKNLQVN